MKSLKLLMTTVIVGAMALTSAAAYAADKGLVGVLMPNKTSLRWINDGDAVKSQLEALGYTVDLQFGADVPAAPVGQTLAADGGAPGKALVTLLSAVERNNWTAIKAVLSPNALERHNHDYNTPAENASGFADLIIGQLAAVA